MQMKKVSQMKEEKKTILKEIVKFENTEMKKNQQRRQVRRMNVVETPRELT
jgi:hypothetical protein